MKSMYFMISCFLVPVMFTYVEITHIEVHEKQEYTGIIFSTLSLLHVTNHMFFDVFHVLMNSWILGLVVFTHVEITDIANDTCSTLNL